MIPKTVFSKYRDDFPLFCKLCLKIKTKDAGIKPLILNDAQIYFYERIKKQLKEIGRVRLIVIKGRQEGLSTVIEALYFWELLYRTGINAFILTHEVEATKNLFSMAKRYYEHFPFKQFMPTQEDSATSLSFSDIECSYKVGTAGNKSVGRSQTIQLFHGSEAAYWQHAEEHASGILQAVPDIDRTFVIFESTSNGVGNFFHQKYIDSLTSESDYELVFIPWFWQKEYIRDLPENYKPTEEEVELKKTYGLSDEQISWRRYKTKELHTFGIDGELKFKQEYPCNAEESFIVTSYDSYLDIERLQKAMNRKEHIEEVGNLILGVDPSGSGKDKTGFCLRTGRVTHRVWTANTKDTMEVVGLVVNLLKDMPAIKYCFIDKIGVGHGVYDRLKELGHSGIVKAVNASDKASKDVYMNLRAEMWARAKEWLEDEPCSLPDDPELLNQLASVGYGADSKGRLQIESKKDIKTDGRPSPDLADAFTYTFAMPVSLNKNTGKINYSNKGIF